MNIYHIKTFKETQRNINVNIQLIKYRIELKKNKSIKNESKLQGQNLELTYKIQLKKRFISITTIIKIKKNEKYKIYEIEQKLLVIIWCLFSFLKFYF